MSIIIRLQNLSWSANAMDIRRFFYGLAIPDGGVHIVGGDKGDAFIAFSTDEDARKAMMLNGGSILDENVKLYLSSKSEMQTVIKAARTSDSDTHKSSPPSTPHLPTNPYAAQQYPSSVTAQTPNNPDWPVKSKAPEWSQTPNNPDWPVKSKAPEWSQTPNNPDWPVKSKAPEWSQTPNNPDWPVKSKAPEWSQTPNNPDWPVKSKAPEWSQTPNNPDWPVKSKAPEWSQSSNPPEWPQHPNAPEWREEQNVPDWPQKPSAPEWPQKPPERHEESYQPSFVSNIMKTPENKFGSEDAKGGGNFDKQQAKQHGYFNTSQSDFRPGVPNIPGGQIPPPGGRGGAVYSHTQPPPVLSRGDPNDAGRQFASSQPWNIQKNERIPVESDQSAHFHPPAVPRAHQLPPHKESIPKLPTTLLGNSPHDKSGSQPFTPVMQSPAGQQQKFTKERDPSQGFNRGREVAMNQPNEYGNTSRGEQQGMGEMEPSFLGASGTPHHDVKPSVSAHGPAGPWHQGPAEQTEETFRHNHRPPFGRGMPGPGMSREPPVSRNDSFPPNNQSKRITDNMDGRPANVWQPPTSETGEQTHRPPPQNHRGFDDNADHRPNITGDAQFERQPHADAGRGGPHGLFRGGPPGLRRPQGGRGGPHGMNRTIDEDNRPSADRRDRPFGLEDNEMEAQHGMPGPQSGGRDQFPFGRGVHSDRPFGRGRGMPVGRGRGIPVERREPSDFTRGNEPDNVRRGQDGHDMSFGMAEAQDSRGVFDMSEPQSVGRGGFRGANRGGPHSANKGGRGGPHNFGRGGPLEMTGPQDVDRDRSFETNEPRNFGRGQPLGMRRPDSARRADTGGDEALGINQSAHDMREKPEINERERIGSIRGPPDMRQRPETSGRPSEMRGPPEAPNQDRPDFPGPPFEMRGPPVDKPFGPRSGNRRFSRFDERDAIQVHKQDIMPVEDSRDSQGRMLTGFADRKPQDTPGPFGAATKDQDARRPHGGLPLSRPDNKRDEDQRNAPRRNPPGQGMMPDNDSTQRRPSHVNVKPPNLMDLPEQRPARLQTEGPQSQGLLPTPKKAGILPSPMEQGKGLQFPEEIGLGPGILDTPISLLGSFPGTAGPNQKNRDSGNFPGTGGPNQRMQDSGNFPGKGGPDQRMQDRGNFPGTGGPNQRMQDSGNFPSINQRMQDSGNFPGTGGPNQRMQDINFPATGGPNQRMQDSGNFPGTGGPNQKMQDMNFPATGGPNQRMQDRGNFPGTGGPNQRMQDGRNFPVTSGPNQMMQDPTLVQHEPVINDYNVYRFIVNFPRDINYKDVRQFFSGCMIPANGLKLINDDSGKRNGEAYIKFRSEDDAEKAMELNGTILRGNRIAVLPASKDRFDIAIDSFNPHKAAAQYGASEEDIANAAMLLQSQPMLVGNVMQNQPMMGNPLDRPDNMPPTKSRFQSDEVRMGSPAIGNMPQVIRERHGSQDSGRESRMSSGQRDKQSRERIDSPRRLGERHRNSEERRKSPFHSRNHPRSPLRHRRSRSGGARSPTTVSPYIVVSRLPKSASRQSIRDLFKGLTIARQGDAVHLEVNQRGSLTGSALVQMETESDARDALRKKRCRINGTVVRVYDMPKDEYDERITVSREHDKKYREKRKEEKEKSTEKTSDNNPEESDQNGSSTAKLDSQGSRTEMGENQGAEEVRTSDKQSSPLKRKLPESDKSAAKRQMTETRTANETKIQDKRGNVSPFKDPFNTSNDGPKLSWAEQVNREEEQQNASGDKDEEVCCAMVEGLPSNCTDGKLQQFFRNSTIQHIHLIRTSPQSVHSIGFIEFINSQECKKAMWKNKALLDMSVIAVTGLRKADMLKKKAEALDGMIKKMEANHLKPPIASPVMTPSTNSSRPLLRDPVLHQQPISTPMIPPKTLLPNPTISKPPLANNIGGVKPGCSLRASNLPFRATIQEIAILFKDFNPNADEIRIRYNPMGRPTGEAMIPFFNLEDANRALITLQNTQQMGRPISLQPF